MRLFLSLISLVVLFSTSLFARELTTAEKQLTIVRSELVEVSEERDELQAVLGDLGSILEITDKLIALGEKVWSIVEKGKPVVNKNFIPYSVLPRINDEDTTGAAFYHMYGWSYPVRKKFKITHYNYFNAAVVTFNFTVSFQYGGKYMENGEYLTGIMVTPDTINAKWGFNFDAQSSLMGISNVSNNPLSPTAAATIQVDYQIQNAMTNYQSSMGFFITGDGHIESI